MFPQMKVRASRQGCSRLFKVCSVSGQFAFLFAPNPPEVQTLNPYPTQIGTHVRADVEGANPEPYLRIGCRVYPRLPPGPHHPDPLLPVQDFGSGFRVQGLGLRGEGVGWLPHMQGGPHVRADVEGANPTP